MRNLPPKGTAVLSQRLQPGAPPAGKYEGDRPTGRAVLCTIVHSKLSKTWFKNLLFKTGYGHALV